MMIAALVFSCKTKQPLTSTRALETVNVGTVANDGTGDPLRTAFQKVNAAIEVMNDVSLQLAGGTVGVALADSNKYNGGYATPAWVAANAGSGTSLTGKRLQFIADVTTGAPEAGDTILIHSNFINKHVDIYRDGAKQYRNFTATNTVEGYRIRSGSDTLYVNPAFQANEQIIVDMIEPINWEFISVKDQDLLDGLVAYYKFDETSGTALTDEIGGNTATLDGVVNQDGIVGRAVQLAEARDDITIPFKAGVSLGQSEAFSLSFWLYLDTLQSDVGYEGVLYQQNNNSSPYAPHTITIGATEYADRLTFKVTNTEGRNDMLVRTTDPFSKETWYHIVAVCPGDGGKLQLWVDGVDVSTIQWTFSGNVFQADAAGSLGNAYGSAGNTVFGRYDEFMHYNRALTESEIKKIYNIQSAGNEIF